jgi:hypothetical protein
MPNSIGSTGANPDAGGGVWTGPLVSPPGVEPGSEPEGMTPDSSIGPAVTYTPATPAPDSRTYTDLNALRAQFGVFQANSLEPAANVLRPAAEG